MSSQCTVLTIGMLTDILALAPSDEIFIARVEQRLRDGYTYDKDMCKKYVERIRNNLQSCQEQKAYAPSS
jgi:hypothetical protein